MRRDPVIALKLAGLGALGIVLAWFFAFHVDRTRALDQQISDGFVGLYSHRLENTFGWVPHLSDPPLFLGWFLLIVGVAVWRHRPRLAVTAAVILLGSSLATALVKTTLPIVRHTAVGATVGPNAFPSGHATASMAVALCAILVSPAARRPLVATLGAVYALAVTFTLLMASWHFPSDVFAGYLMAGVWTALGVALLWRLEASRPVAPRAEKLALRDAMQPVVAVLASVVGAALFVVALRPDSVVDYAHHHTTFVVGAGVLGVLALGLVGFLAAAAPTSRRPPHAS
jgi:membrane-associated phospholipid phosphatase